MPPRTTNPTRTNSDHALQDQVKLNWLRNAVKQGLDEIEQGQGIEFSSFAQLKEAINQVAEVAMAHKARQAQAPNPPARSTARRVPARRPTL